MSGAAAGNAALRKRRPRIIDRIKGVIHVDRSSVDGRYATQRQFERGATIELTAYPDERINTSEVLPPP